MLTPEERYERMIRDYHTSPHTMQELMIITIREAQEAERERCAALAERLGSRWIDTPVDAYNACLGVAGHIRATS